MIILSRRKAFKLQLFFTLLVSSTCLAWPAQASTSDSVVMVGTQAGQSLAVIQSKHDDSIARRIVHVVILSERVVVMVVLNLVESGLMLLDTRLESIEGWLSTILYDASNDDRATQPC